MGESSTQSFCLKILVAKEENKVILAEADKEFIDVLFSFMVMPIASAIRLTRQCLSGDIGCLNNLYGNVENLDMNFLKTERCRDILLNPRSAADIYCKNLKLNLIESSCNELYTCDNTDCKLVRYYPNGTCHCGLVLNRRLKKSRHSSFFPGEEGVFLKSTARFMITDDFKVMPVSTMTGLPLLNELGKYRKVQERTINIGSDEVLKLLVCSLRSRTPLSDTFLEPSIDKSSSELLDMKYGPGGLNPRKEVNDFWKIRTNIHLKLIFDKVNNMVLYAVAQEDFVNQLCNFLTFPLGYIFHRFPSLSFKGCMGNIHKSIQDTNVNLFCCKDKKEILVDPKLAPGLAFNGNLIGIKEAIIPSGCSTCLSLSLAVHRDPYNTPIQAEQMVFDGCIKGPSMFMVMDNLEVKPLSPTSVKSLVDKLMVPLCDIAEQEVILDKDKALHLLAASLASEHALTSTFLGKETNIDCLDFLRLMWKGKGIGFKGY